MRGAEAGNASSRPRSDSAWASSLTSTARSARSSSARARRMPSISIGSADSRKPAVSTRVRAMPSRWIVSRSTSRVVPGISVTIARSLAAKRLSRLDLPAFGRPMMTTCRPSSRRTPRRLAARMSSSWSRRRSRSPSTAGSARKSTSSSGKSMAASIQTRRRTTPSARACTCREKSPSRLRTAARAAASEPLAIRSAIASAWARSILPLRKARSENSPGRAWRAPSAMQRSSRQRSMTGLPCTCSSSTSSPVNECGAGKCSSRPRSSTASVASVNAQ